MLDVKDIVKIKMARMISCSLTNDIIDSDKKLHKKIIKKIMKRQHNKESCENQPKTEE